MTVVRGYCAVSIDGFIAGADDDLSWLGGDDAAPRDQGTLSFEELMVRTGAILMGRRTFDVVQGFGGEWPYGDTPVLVATTRPLDDPRVRPVAGTLDQLVEVARSVAGEKDVYVDGGRLISGALDAGLLDELILSVVPVVLGRGVPLYRGETRHRFEQSLLGRYAGTHQLRLRPKA